MTVLLFISMWEISYDIQFILSDWRAATVNLTFVL